MKKFIIASAAFLFSSLAFAQVKNYVGIARQKYSDAQIKFLEDFRDKLQNRGYNSYAEYVDSYLKGGFGSAFVYVDKDGQNYIVTNRHVVSQAASVSLEFEKDDGSLAKYDNLYVLVTDDDIDLAILRFENNANYFKRGLSFYAGKVYDGQDVVSAGFPGLGDEPVWQFGKGSVTNSAARIKDLIDPAISTVIQHSAQIDAGNSGGPLLVASKSAATGYDVIGVNTWKAVGRDATNFSIPAALALKLIERSKKPLDDKAFKAERQEKFKAVLSEPNSDYTALVKFISYDMAAQKGMDCFEEIFKHGATKVKNRVAAEFAMNPIEGLRYAVAHDLYGKMSGEGLDEKLSNLVWEKESGVYRIASVQGTDGEKKSKPKAKKSGKDDGEAEKKSGDKKSKVSWQGFVSPYTVAVTGGALIPVVKDKSNVELSAGFIAGLEFLPFERNIGGFFEFEHRKIGGESLNIFGVGAVARLPLCFGLFTISPKADAGLKIAFGKVRDFQFFADLGLLATFDFGSSFFRPGFEVGCRGATDTLHFSDASSAALSLRRADFYAKVILGFKL
jgi:serine protease Do